VRIVGLERITVHFPDVLGILCIDFCSCGARLDLLGVVFPERKLFVVVALERDPWNRELLARTARKPCAVVRYSTECVHHTLELGVARRRRRRQALRRARINRWSFESRGGGAATSHPTATCVEPPPASTLTATLQRADDCNEISTRTPDISHL
jgi:hypothetical protein